MVGQVHELVDEVRLVQIVGNGTQLFVGRQATSVDSQPKHVRMYNSLIVNTRWISEKKCFFLETDHFIILLQETLATHSVTHS